ncbi:MAG: hypothetical protein U1F76_12810 [Candidatus Competibacteraceae bacterium]
MKQILIVEDDAWQADWIEKEIKRHFTNVRIEKVATEYDFRIKLENLKENPPNIILLDVMLRWTDPSPNIIPAPEDVREEGLFYAGFRCERLLREASETEVIPVIFYTVLEKDDIQDRLKKYESSNTYYIPKDANSVLSLVNLIYKILYISDT